MTNFVDQLRLAERAKEDIYFARIDRELIHALHQQEQLNQLTPAENKRHLTQPDTTSGQEEVSRTGPEADK